MRLGADAAAKVGEQIRGLIRDALKPIGVRFEDAYLQNTGDGAILVFDTTMLADLFAGNLLELADLEFNHGAGSFAQERRFRIGIYQGPVVLGSVKTDTAGRPVPGSIAGDAVNYARRLEAAAPVGGILMDRGAWAQLPPHRRDLYGPEEEIAGKGDEWFRAHRRTVGQPATGPAERQNQALTL